VVHDFFFWRVHNLPMHPYPVGTIFAINLPGRIRQPMLFSYVPLEFGYAIKIITINDRRIIRMDWNHCEVG
jgi:hypothetical protein